MTTVAPGTTPFGSLTVPTIVPVVTCAATGAVQADAVTTNNTAAKAERFIMAAPSPEPAEASLRARRVESIENRSCRGACHQTKLVVKYHSLRFAALARI